MMLDNLSIDNSIHERTRPRHLSDIVGQEQIKKSLSILLKSTTSGTPLCHLLLSGPSGLGKTTMAQVVADELSRSISIMDGASITDYFAIELAITKMKYSGILFIDEVHAVSPEVLTSLNKPLDSGYLIDGIERTKLKDFTLLCATTNPGKLPITLRNRMGMEYRFNYYSDDEIYAILKGASRRSRTSATDGALRFLAQRSRGIPRLAIRHLARCNDYIVAKKLNKIDTRIAHLYTSDIGIDEYGLEYVERKLIGIMLNTLGNRATGLKSLSAMLGEDEDTVSNYIEPYLVRKGIVLRTPKGRVLSELGIAIAYS